MAQILLLIRCLHLVPTPALRAFPLRRTLLLQSVIQQLVLIQVIGEGQLKFDLFVLGRGLASLIAILNLLGHHQILGDLVGSLIGVTCSGSAVLRRDTLLVCLLVILTRLE